MSRTLKVALLWLCLALGSSLFAQERHAPPAEAAEPHAAQQASDAHAPQGEHAEEGEGGHNAFRESPSVKWLAEVTGLPLGAAWWVAVVFNFAIVAGVVGYALRKKLPGVFSRRTEGIQHDMREAEKASAEANRRLTEIESRLARLDSEIAEMRAAAEADAIAEEERIRAAAEQDKAKIVAAAQQEIALAAKVARRELQAHAAELAVSLAARRIQIDSATDQALVRHFTAQLGSDTSGSKDGRNS